MTDALNHKSRNAAALNHYLTYRHRYMALFAFSACTLMGLVNASGIIMREAREASPVVTWEPWILEMSSSLAVLLLIPGLVWFQRKLNLSWQNVRWKILWHLPALAIFSILHVTLFVMLRKLGFALFDTTYIFDEPLWFGWLYELRLDAVTYSATMLLIYAHEFFVNRLQGEATLMGAAPQSDQAVFDRASIPAKYPTQFLVKMLHQEYLVDVNSIQWVEAAKNYVLLHCAERTYPMRKPISRLVEELDPTQFVRVHRSAVVNLAHLMPGQAIRGLKAVQLKSGVTVPVSPTFQDALNRSTIHP